MLGARQQSFLSDYRLVTDPHPNANIRRIFAQQVELIVQCDEDPTGRFRIGMDQVVLDYIFAKSRKRGFATQAMLSLVSLADRHQLEFGLVASPMKKHPITKQPLGQIMNFDRLVEWYEGFGFRMVRGGQRNVMLREPMIESSGGFTEADFMRQAVG